MSAEFIPLTKIAGGATVLVNLSTIRAIEPVYGSAAGGSWIVFSGNFNSEGNIAVAENQGVIIERIKKVRST